MAISSTKREAYHISDYIDRSRIMHKDLAKALDMKEYSFSDRYCGRVRWKRYELMTLANAIGCTYEELTE